MADITSMEEEHDKEDVVTEVESQNEKEAKTEENAAENKVEEKTTAKAKVEETLKQVTKSEDNIDDGEVKEEDIDLFSDTAMNNAYSICHNIQVRNNFLKFLIFLGLHVLQRIQVEWNYKKEEEKEKENIVILVSK